MAASQSRVLQASAEPYVRKETSFVPTPATPGFETYMGPPAAALVPLGSYPLSGLIPPPPPPGLPGTSLGCWGFLQGPCVGMQVAAQPGWAPLTPMATGVRTAPAGLRCGPQLQPLNPAIEHARGGWARRWGDVPPRLRRVAGRAAPPSSRGADVAGNGCDGAAKGPVAANEPSPRSVLVRTSSPDSPSALPISFPYPELSSSLPASVGLAPATKPCAVNAPDNGSPPVVPQQRTRRVRASYRFRQAAGGVPKPRLFFDPSSSSTSLMIRNIPNDFRRTRLMRIIDHHCYVENDRITSGDVRSEYDFLYLPMDFRSGANKGYAFVNLTTPEAARRLRDYLHGHRWNVMRSGKICEVDHAYIEGLEKLVKNFSDSRFDCGDEEFLPVWFEPARDGTRTPLPHLVGRMLRCS